MQRQQTYAVSPQAINLLLAVESRMDGQLFKGALERPRQGFNVISCSGPQHELVQTLQAHDLDVAVINESLHDGALLGFQFLNQLHTVSPKVRAIMLLKEDKSDLVVDAFRAGAKGVFCRTDCITWLPKCIRSVHQGQIWANSQHLDRVLEAFASAAPLKLTNERGQRLLTKREEDVVKLVVEGYSNRETAQKLGLTEHTVSNYLFCIYDKLGIATRVELVLYSLKKNQR